MTSTVPLGEEEVAPSSGLLSTGRSRPSPGLFWPSLLASVILALGAWLRCYEIAYNFDHDEVFSVEIARQPFFTAVRRSLADRSHPPLHYLSLWAWVHLAGTSEAWVRVPNIVISLTALHLLWRLALRLMNAWFALLPVFLCAVSPFFVFYGEEARPYALAQLFATLSLYCLVRTWDEPGTWRWPAAYGLSCLALLYTQYLGALLVGSQLLVGMLLPRLTRARLLVAGTLGCAAVVPWMLAAALYRGSDALPWVPVWIDTPNRLGLFELYAGFFGTFDTAGTTRLLLLATVLAGAAALYRWLSLLTWPVGVVVASAAAPPLIAFSVSLLGSVSIWAPRHLIGSAVAIMVVLGILLDRSPTFAGWPLAIAFSLWSLLTSPNSAPDISKPPYRALASELARESQVLLGLEEWVVRPLRYYSPIPVRHVREVDSLHASTMILVCRAANCRAWTDSDGRYDTTLLRSVTWTPKPTPLSTLEVYLLSPKY